MVYKVTFLSTEGIEMNENEFNKLMYNSHLNLTEFTLEHKKRSSISTKKADTRFTIYNGMIIKCNSSDK